MQLSIGCAQVDGNGNAWVAGCTYGSLDGHTRAGTNGWRDMFLMKFDAQGIHQWTRQRGDRYDDCATSLQADGVRRSEICPMEQNFRCHTRARARRCARARARVCVCESSQ